MSSHNSNSTDDLKQRVQRVESELDELRNYHTATDEEGNEWSVTKLVTDVGLSRRQAFYVIAALAGGGSLINALTDVTSAQASGGTLYVDQIGDSGNRVSDLYVDTVNSLTDTNTLTANVDGDGYDITNLGALDTDELSVSSQAAQFALDGYVVPVAPGLGVSDAIDPSSTSTPVSDARDAVRAATGGVGTIVLPPTTVTEGAPLRLTGNTIGIQGWGMFQSVVEFTDLASDGIIIDGADQVHLDGFEIHGSDVASRTGGYAMHWVNDAGEGEVAQNNIGRLSFDEWTNAAFYFDSAHPYSSHWGIVRAGTSNHGGCIDAINSAGPGLSIDNIRWSPGGSSTPHIVKLGGVGSSTISDCGVSIDTINVGGDPGPALHCRVSGPVSVNNITWFSQSSVEACVVVEGGRLSVNHVRASANATVDAAVRFKDLYYGSYRLGRVTTEGTGTFTNRVEMATDNTNGEVGLYEGPASDITVSPTSISNGIVALHDLTTVTS